MCTVFHVHDAEDYNVIGKNYDIQGDSPITLFINKRGIPKTAIIKPPERPIQWISRFGSVTFNGVGAEFPVCGMNEDGLVVEQTTLWNTVYPDRDDKPAIKELQWIQFMLDTCSSVQDVLARQQGVRIAQNQSRLQFVIADKSGQRVLIEYILGECIVHTELDQTNFVIANDMLATSQDYLAIHAGYGGKKAIVSTEMSLDRYVVTRDWLERGPRPADTMGWFNVLERSRFAETKWQVVYDLHALTVYVRTSTDEKPEKFDLKLLAFADHKRPDYMDLYTRNEFKAITHEANLALMHNFFTDPYITQFIRARDQDIITANEGVSRYYSGGSL